MSNVSLLTEKAKSGDIKAMRELVRRHMEGDGVEVNPEAVCDWLEKAATLGDAESQADWADIIRATDGDPEEAFRWTQKSAEQGFPLAQHNLAVCFKDGIGTPVNLEKQCHWYQKAAENGWVESQLQLSRCYLHGDGIPQDFQRSVYWLQQAANQGNAEAKRRLGVAYHEGIGIEIDKEKGLALLREAASLGDETAKELLNSRSGTGGGCLVSIAVLGTLVTSSICCLILFAPIVWKF